MIVVIDQCGVYYGALHFMSEMTSRNKTEFTLCCHKGKAIIPSLSQNEFCQGLDSIDRLQ